ncbi:DUF6364 family protein [uncultured Roseivirga sp.]|uniref:DUF6364 family protein n=1 Tax=uncultured Roseivirga sp. TaxID=543088 RepID=UPI000D79E216|nr:DUF6364 family protein [uncultured Roseivirga sp.]PWL32108.1 MAG: hypothetical protein DCO95_02695 [Roseivirga sp. XM-24bin3]
MNTKLTLSLDKEVIAEAKAYAKATGRSLSEMVETYLKKVTKPQKVDEEELSEDLKKLYGCIKLPADFDYKKEMGNILYEKYMKE